METRAVCHGKFPCQLPYRLNLRQRLRIKTSPMDIALLDQVWARCYLWHLFILRMILLLLFKHLQVYFFLMRNYRLPLLPGFGTREMKRELVATLTKAIDKILWSDMCAMCLDPFRICVILRIVVAALVEYASGKLAI